MGFSGRYLTLNAAVRVNQIEVRHDLAVGEDERALHTPEAVEQFREAVQRGFPEGRVSWAFSWQALNSGEANYRAVRELVRGYVNQYGDEFTYLAGGYFANAYNTHG
jgi:hypothetical protein